MVTPVEGVRQFQARRALRPVVGLFAVGLGLSVVYARTGVGVPCPFRALTGWSCPLCGSTRMGSALLHAEWAQAFASNPVVLVALVVLAVAAASWAVEALGGPACRLPGSLTTRLRRVPAPGWLLAGLAGAVVYTLVRNLG